MAIVAGVDFGTLSVRISIVDSERGLLASAIAEYPLHRKKENPEYATQSHEDHLRALAAATREAVRKADVRSEAVEAIANSPTFRSGLEWRNRGTGRTRTCLCWGIWGRRRVGANAGKHN